jgi:hypothetical protein
MSERVEVLIIALLYKLLTLGAGVFCLWLGYKLFRQRIRGKAGDVSAGAVGKTLRFKDASPGTFFVVLGTILVGIAILRPIKVESNVHGTNMSVNATNASTDGVKNLAQYPDQKEYPDLKAFLPTTPVKGKVPTEAIR